MKRTTFILTVILAFVAAFAAAPAAGASSSGWTAHKAAGVPLLSVAAAGPAHAWAVGPGPTIVATTDGGSTWDAQNAPIVADLYGVAFSDASDGWAVGAGDDVGALVATTDGGVDWAPQTIPTTAALIGVACRGEDCWAVGAAGTIIATTDGGSSWAAQSSPTGSDLYSVTFSDPDHGWAVGDQGRIIATTDGGAVWTSQRSPTGRYLNGVTCNGPQRAWAVGEKGIIIATTDGGAHWLVRRTAKAGDLYTVAFSDRRRGWAVGVGGVILATTSGGATWRAQGCPTGEDLSSVAFADSLHGFVAGVAGTVLTSTRAGWSERRPPVATVAAVIAKTGFGPGFPAPVAPRWYGSAARVELGASDGRGGSGVASIHYSFDHGKTWVRSVSFTVAAPADHSGDGAHPFLYRATDNAGNVEAPRTGWVRIDTRRPRPVAKWSAAAVRGARTALRFFVSDPRPGSPTATAIIRIHNARGVLVRKAVLVNVAVDRALDYVFVCRLPIGVYRFTVVATDGAGNRGSVVTANRLIVRDRPGGFAGPLAR